MNLLTLFAISTALCTPAPTIELPAFKASDRFAVMVTGDGGWRRIDAKVTDDLRSNGIPIVGFIA